MNEKILIAVSDASLGTAIAQALKKAKYVPERVQNGKDVINKMKIFKPDLLLIDTVLPGKSGYDILNEKSFDRDITKIPVIIVSNAGTPLKMNQIPSTPMIKDYVVKSHVEPDEIIQKINKIFNRTTMETETGKKGLIGAGKTILWVEDDRLLSTILSKKFEGTGYKLLKANKGDEAFEYLKTEIPDIVILDLLLPEMSGFDILQKIKMNEKLRKIPVIMLSNMSKQSDIDKAKVLGANKFIVKAAVSLDEIIREVENLIKD